MRKSILTACLFGVMVAFPFIAAPVQAPVLFPEPLSPRIANYEINVTLNKQTRMLEGNLLLTWVNQTDAAAPDVQLHLYQNAFRNNQSTFIKESGEAKAEKNFKKGGWGFINILGINLPDGTDLLDKMEFIHPDDDNAADKTVARVALPSAILPGGVLVMEIRFEEKLPEPAYARSGAWKEFFFASQWFPKIGVFEDGKWNCHQYHAKSEFYADYGVYDVRITVPEKNMVGATGVLVEKKDNGDGTATHWYHAEDVHDFAWTTSPKFVELKGQAQDVEIRVLVQKERAYQAERHLEAAQLAVEYFQNWYGDYPFPNLTVVDPRAGAGETGGMEYPTLITAGTYWGLPRGLRTLEMVIIHEFGHNYWYHLTGNNEFEEPWLDEGINTYSEIRIMHDIYGKETSMVDFLGLKGDDLQMRRMSYVAAPDNDAMLNTSWGFYNGSSYRANAYSKPALGLLTLDYHLGGTVMREILAEFLKRFRFKHPRTKDFLQTANDVAGRDLSWFFDQLLYTNEVLDYSVDFVSTRELPRPRGIDYTQESGGEKIAAPLEGGAKQYISEIKVRRLGGFIFPVTIEFEFENGEKVRENWDGKDLWKRYIFIRESKLKKATVDPDGVVVLDLHWKNNSRTPKADKPKAMPTNYYIQMLKFVMDPP